MDLFDHAEAKATTEQKSFASIRQGRDWLEKNGWQPRHGGGYEKAGGFAVMRSRDGGVIVETGRNSGAFR